MSASNPLSSERLSTSLGLLALRVAGAGMLMTHGVAKVQRLDTLWTNFGDPLGLGPSTSVALAIFGELVCTSLVVLGVFTRLATIPWAITMIVAAFIVEGAAPFSAKELALLYLTIAVTLTITGPGRLSFDGWLASKRAWAARLVA